MRELVVPAGQTVSESGIELYGFRVLSAPVGSSWTENDSPVSRAIVAAGEYRPSGWKRGSGSALRKLSFTAGAGGVLRVELAVDADEWFGVMQPLQQTDANGNVLVASAQLPAALDANGNLKAGTPVPVRILNGTLVNQPGAGTSTAFATADLSLFRTVQFILGAMTLDAGTAKARLVGQDPPSGGALVGNMDGAAAASGSYSGVMAGETAQGFANITAVAYRMRKTAGQVVYAGGAGVNNVPWELWGYP